MACPLEELSDAWIDVDLLTKAEHDKVGEELARIRHKISAGHKLSTSEEDILSEYYTKPIYISAKDYDIIGEPPVDSEGFIHAYTGYDGEEYNLLLRGLASSDEYAKDAAALKRTLDGQPENIRGAFYRGTSINETRLALLNNLSEGALLTNPSFLSTTTNSHVAAHFADITMLRPPSISLMLYIDGAGHAVSDLSAHHTEAEVLMNVGKYFQLLEKKVYPHEVHIVLEEVRSDIAKEVIRERRRSVDKSLLSLAGLTIFGGMAEETKAATVYGLQMDASVVDDNLVVTSSDVGIADILTEARAKGVTKVTLPKKYRNRITTYKRSNGGKVKPKDGTIVYTLPTSNKGK